MKSGKVYNSASCKHLYYCLIKITLIRYLAAILFTVKFRVCQVAQKLYNKFWI